LVRDLAKKKIKVKEQAQIFINETGLSRRTFFTYRESIDELRS
jgi:ACT domain-containing protein